jgi:hypothetical protein
VKLKTLDESVEALVRKTSGLFLPPCEFMIRKRFLLDAPSRPALFLS